MEKNCDIRKIINPNELVGMFYKFIVEDEKLYNVKDKW